MTKRLILIRHAKSNWSDPFADDHARVLNDRGRASAPAIGSWMAKNDYSPDVVLCSDANRTTETADLILQQLAPQPALRLSAQIYHAAPMTLLELIQRETADSLALIGHNPGIGMLANMLVAAVPHHTRFSDYPTCATAVIDFEINDWRAISPRSGTCVDFIVPRDLIGTSRTDID